MVVIHKLANGLTIVLEPIGHVESVAYDLLIPGGLVNDANDLIGASLILPDLTTRGAGDFNSRQLSAEFESYGIRHSEGTGQEQFVYRGACLSENLAKALELMSLMVLKPQLPEHEVDNIKSLLLQDIKSLSDNPARRVAVELAQRYYPEPFARCSLGTESGLLATNQQTLKEMWTNSFLPSGSVLSVAGKIDVDKILELIEANFGSWQGQALKRTQFGTLPAFSKTHIHFESQQLQIALAYPSAPFGDSDYYTAKLATGMLSGGMFGRLFLEVREKRGLCYSVYARHASTSSYGQIYAYSGTTAERAHETLAVMLEVLNSLKGNATQEELDRARANVMAQLIMGEESTSSRASSNATDWWLSEKVRSLDEVKTGLQVVSLADIDRYLNRYPVDDYTLVTLGAKQVF